MLGSNRREERINKIRSYMPLRIIAVTFASFLMAVNINTFVHTGGLLPGGASGLTLLLQEAAGTYLGIKLPYTLINTIINAVPVYIGYRYIGKKFTLLSCYVIVLTSVLADILPSYSVTQDTLLISIFGGLINGFAISLCLLMDATSGGTDFIAIYLSEKRGIDSFSIPLVINACILIAAGLLFNWDKALYSILFQFEAVCEAIHDACNHGATVLEGEGSYEHCERNVVYSVVSGAESGRVIRAVKDADGEAFVNVLKTERVIGRFYQRPTD